MPDCCAAVARIDGIVIDAGDGDPLRAVPVSRGESQSSRHGCCAGSVALRSDGDRRTGAAVEPQGVAAPSAVLTHAERLFADRYPGPVIINNPDRHAARVRAA